MKLFLCAAILFLAGAPGAAQVREFTRRKVPRLEPSPVALALHLAFSTTFWQEVQISTSGPVSDLSQLSRDGYYKLEIIELLLMSHEARKPLSATVAKRKKGAALADIAADYHLEYGKVYESALAVQEIVDKQYLPLYPEKRPRRERDE